MSWGLTLTGIQDKFIIHSVFSICFDLKPDNDVEDEKNMLTRTENQVDWESFNFQASTNN